MKRILSLVVLSILCLDVCVLRNEYFPEPKFVSIIEKVVPAVVDIKCVIEAKNPFTGKMDKGQVEGSGVYISPKGYILTCGHLFNFKKIYAINITNPQGETVSARLLQVNFKRDLALLKVDFYEVTPFVRLVDPRKVQVGQEVFAIGSPLGFEFSVSNGIISAMFRDVGNMYNCLQTNTAINPGNSGGPMFNLKGQLVGINSFMVTPSSFDPVFTGLGFCVSPAECYTFLIKCGKTIPELREKHNLRLVLLWGLYVYK